MTVAFFTKKPDARSRFPVSKGRSGPSIEILPFSGLKRGLSSLADDSLVYVDVRGLTEAERRKAITTLADSPVLGYGIFDPEGSIKDPAQLFHAGAVDYVGKGLLLTGLGPKRFAAVAEYARQGMPDAGPSEAVADGPGDAAAQGDAWADVVPGREHPFAILYIEVDDTEELKKRHEPANLSEAMETFKAFVSGIATRHGGRLWMWSRFGGLVLFPQRQGRCPAVLCCTRILLDSIFYDIEESRMPGRLSFRMALSCGPLVYKEGDTGRIVSDSLNSIFHLGQRFTPARQFYVTSKTLDAAPPSLKPFFVAVGTFEGQRIHRMLLPSSSLGSREENGVCRT
jgi:hypothetical protein